MRASVEHFRCILVSLCSVESDGTLIKNVGIHVRYSSSSTLSKRESTVQMMRHECVQDQHRLKVYQRCPEKHQDCESKADTFSSAISCAVGNLLNTHI